MAEQLKVFVSHSHQDDAFCRQLVAALRGAGADVWYDEHNMGPGQLGPTIEHELRVRPVFVLILSPAALTSAWVEDESRWAYSFYRKDRARTILPVLAAPVSDNDIWVFLQDFKRIEAAGVRPYPVAEAAQRTLHALGLGAAGAVAPEQGETAEALVIRGKALDAQQRYAEALPLFQRATQLDPSSVDAWGDLGYTLMRLRRYQEALAATEKAITLDPTDAMGWNNKAVILYEFHRPKEALAAAEKAITLDPTNATAWNSKAGVLLSLRHPQEALAAAEKAVTLDPTNAMAWNSKAGILHNLRRYQEALAAVERAIALDPTNAHVWSNKAAMLVSQRRYSEALAAAEKALSLDIANLNAWIHIAIALRGLGRTKEAKEAEARAKSLRGT
jgi:tetratricopeptide (TPR) repeat protein